MIIYGDTEVQIRYVQSDKPYLVDVPVRINIWIREECQKKQFEILRQARPSTLFLISDGGRNDKEWEIIRRNRLLFEKEIDWCCTVYSLFESKNNGLYTMSRKGCDLIWSRTDRCIFLEDDVLPSVSFFRFCAELLERYKDDPRIECICGMNHLEVWNDASSDYFFSRQGSIWGTATWKRTFDVRNDFSYGQDAYTMKLLKQETKSNPAFMKKIEAYAHNELHEGHVAGGEFWKEFAMYAHNRLQIVPKYNMISNIGYGSDSAHAKEFLCIPKVVRNLFDMTVHELEGPITHPKYVIADEAYEKARNRIMAYNNPWAKFCQKVEVTFLRIKHNGLFKWFFAFLKRKLRKNIATHEK